MTLSHSSVLEVSTLDDVTGARSSKDKPELYFDQCNESQSSALTHSVNHLEKTLGKLESQVKNYHTDSLTNKEKKFLKSVSKTLACVRNKIESELTFKCSVDKQCETSLMYVQRILLIPHSLQNNTIHSCLESVYYNIPVTAGIILHEITHLCGTKDFEYYLDGEEVNTEPQLNYDYKIKRKGEEFTAKKRVIAKRGHKNADSYRYWYEMGFCMPNRDCKQ